MDPRRRDRWAEADARPFPPFEGEEAFLASLLEEVREDLGDGSERRLAEALAAAGRSARAWGVELREGLPGATCSLVLAGVQEGREVVLRVPLLDWEREGAGALRAFAGHGGVAVLREDAASGAALMPRLRPGTTLDSLGEDEAIEVWIALARRLRGATGEAASVAAYLAPLWTEPTGLRLRTDAPALARRLVETSPAPRLLHGDLHHYNVLRDGDVWVAIDPEGVTGDPAYEAAAFLRNPAPAIGREPNLASLLRRRIVRIAEGLGDPAERIWGWALVRTALCVWDGPDAFEGAWLEVVRALDALAPEFAGAL